MKATRILHDLGQSLWLDNITRNLLRTGVLRRYIDEFSVTGLTSNPTIFDHAIKNSSDYDDAIKSKLAEGKSGEKLFFELALEDLTQAADLFRPTFDATDGVDGWASMEVSPLLANDTRGSIDAAARIHRQADRANLFVRQFLDLHYFMRSTKAVKDVQEWNARLERGRLRDQRKVHHFLNRVGKEHSPAGRARSHHVTMIAKD